MRPGLVITLSGASGPVNVAGTLGKSEGPRSQENPRGSGSQVLYPLIGQHRSVIMDKDAPNERAICVQHAYNIHSGRTWTVVDDRGVDTRK
jgi:hypothetical protein